MRHARNIGIMCLFGLPLWLTASLEPARAAEGEQRYPYDPVCAWGRIADGHGMLVRCLNEQEAAALGVPASGATAAASKDKGKEPDKQTKPSAPDAGASVAEPKRELVVDKVGPIVVDTGDLPLAVKKLSEARERYLDCVQKNGGLSADRGEVQVRFLVRERGRAEGVSVAKRKGMSEEAAHCIADVVDRRYVGYPAAPIVGATLSVSIGYKK